MNNKLQQCMILIDQANSADPNKTMVGGELISNEVLYSQRMLLTLNAFDQTASDALILACYAQHVCRWILARRDFPAGLEGYLTWRKELAKSHAKILGDIMVQGGYSDDIVSRGQHIIQKRKLKSDAESQTLEDVSCLVFLNHYFEAFAAKHSEQRVIDIVQKTWAKMSEKGHQAALELTLLPHLQALVSKALS